jgi:hypothetical protein
MNKYKIECMPVGKECNTTILVEEVLNAIEGEKSFISLSDLNIKK